MACGVTLVEPVGLNDWFVGMRELAVGVVPWGYGAYTSGPGVDRKLRSPI